MPLGQFSRLKKGRGLRASILSLPGKFLKGGGQLAWSWYILFSVKSFCSREILTKKPDKMGFWNLNLKNISINKGDCNRPTFIWEVANFTAPNSSYWKKNSEYFLKSLKKANNFLANTFWKFLWIANKKQVFREAFSE